MPADFSLPPQQVTGHVGADGLPTSALSPLIRPAAPSLAPRERLPRGEGHSLSGPGSQTRHPWSPSTPASCGPGGDLEGKATPTGSQCGQTSLHTRVRGAVLPGRRAPSQSRAHRGDSEVSLRVVTSASFSLAAAERKPCHRYRNGPRLTEPTLKAEASCHLSSDKETGHGAKCRVS